MSRRNRRGPTLAGRGAPHTQGCVSTVTDEAPPGNGPASSEHGCLRDRLLFSMDEVAELTGVSLPVVRRWVAAGYLVPVQLPLLTRRRLFHRDAVLTFIANPEAGHERPTV